MNIRTTLSAFTALAIVSGLCLFQMGCGGGSGLPSAVYISESYSVPTVKLTTLTQAGDPALVGIGSSFKITWETVNAASDSVAKIFLSTSGTVDNSSIEITPTGGVLSSTKSFTFSPTRTTGSTGVDYTVFIQLISGQIIFDTDAGAQKLRIGDGGLQFTYPTSALTLARGLPIDVTWVVTNNLCEDYKEKTKIVRLYVDTKTQFDNTTAIEVTGVDGVDACLNTFEIKTGEVKGLALNTPYYILGRLFIDGVEHSRVVTDNPFTMTASLKATAPLVDVQTNLQAITVSWEVLGRDPSGLSVEVLAVVPNATNDPERIISGEFSAEKGSGVADASKLPAGTYNIVIRLFERDATLAKSTLDTATAAGRILISPGYLGNYDLSDMSAATTRNYSPVDGTVFTGFNINDESGYEVAGLGDLDGDNRTDFMIFSRHGQEYTTGNAGEGYLIYGRDNFTSPVINLNSIASPDSTGRPADGTLVLFPMENLSVMDGPTATGAYQVIGTPDCSGDQKGDLLVGCPQARPLQIQFTDETGSGVTFTDHYGLQRAIPKDDSDIEPAHVHSFLRFLAPNGVPYSLTYGYDYNTGDYIHVHVYTDYLDIEVFSVHEKRGTSYLFTSQRLSQYRNKVFDMAKIGSPSEMDGLSLGAQYDQMFVWMDAGVEYGAGVSVLPDRDGDQSPEYIITAPQHTVHDTNRPDAPARANAGKARIYGSEYRWTSISWRNDGQIAWAFPGNWFDSSAWGTYGDYSEFDILGAQEGSRLSTAAGLGRFASLNSTDNYTSGDFNGDTIPDVVCGCPGEGNNSGSIYIVPIRPVMGHRVSYIDLADFNKPQTPEPEANLEVPVLGLKITGTVAGEELGSVVKPVGDFNGDGLADVMFSTAKANASGRAEAGRVFLVFGENQLGDFTLDDVGSQLGTQIPAMVFEGQNAFDHLGTRICAVYDVNGDGMDDILLAAPDAGAPGKNGCGKIYLIYGKKNIVKTDPGTGFKFVDYDNDGQPDDYWNVQSIGTQLPGAVFFGEHTNTHLQAIAPAGDVNGDGLGDFLLGAPNTNVSTVQQNAGKAYLVLGRKYVVPQ